MRILSTPRRLAASPRARLGRLVVLAGLAATGCTSSASSDGSTALAASDTTAPADTPAPDDAAAPEDTSTPEGDTAAPNPDAGPCDAPPAGSPLAALCALPPSDAPLLGPPVVVSPSDALPPEVQSQLAHNNLDAEWHQGRLFLAVRTAPSHFASADTTMFVVSTPDLATWRFEGRFALGTDVREPQLVSWQGTLRLSFAVLGDNPLAFEPEGSRRATWLGPGTFGPAEPAFDGDLLPWRIKRLRGPDGVERVHLLGYRGGANIYELDGEPIEITWLASDDGLAFDSAVSGGPVVWRGGASESDVVFEEDGSVTAVARNEAGDEVGFGSLVCHAPADAPAAWECAHDKRKYDSPLLFRHKGTNWLVARRNVTETGFYDLDHDDKSLAAQATDYQLDYWNRPKRCALWTVDGAQKVVTHVLDLPSRGDTCFPERVELNEHTSLLFNYTSPLDPEGVETPDPGWADGQLAATQVVYTSLQLP